MAARRVLLALFACISLVQMLGASPVSGAEWLPEGDFESGVAGWIENGTPQACPEHEGLGALGVLAGAGGQPTRVRRSVSGDLPSGTYTLTGWIRLQSGQAEVRLSSLAFERPGVGLGGILVPVPIVVTSEYTEFTFNTTVNFEPESALIAFEVSTDSAGVVCFDNLQLTSEDPLPTATATATATDVPTATATATATATSTMPPAAATATSTPTSPAPSATPTRTPTPQPSATPSPGFGFTNGGFEQGLTGWSKYGGELSTTGAAYAGGTAGLLTSDTESTKWAFQPVPVDESRFYEFSAYLRPDDGVLEAYLRISWYPTGDASGPALASTDSLSRSTGGSSSFEFHTTGAVTPPPGSQSARVRILLAPVSVGPASLTIDEVAFYETVAPTATPTTTGTPLPTAEASSTPPVPLLGAVVPSPGPSDPVAPGLDAGAPAAESAASSTNGAAEIDHPVAIPTVVVEVASERQDPERDERQPPALPEDRFAPPREPGSGLPWAWLAGVALVVVGLAGAWWQNRQAPR